MKLLHVGCGTLDKSSTTDVFARDEWKETRLDIDDSVNPDIVASITDMNAIEDKSYDAVYSAHNIEHLYAHEVPLALKEFHRVLKDNGTAFIRCPDLLTIAEYIVKGKIVEPMYQSPAGPVCPIDALFGMRSLLVENSFMAHRIGFTSELLTGSLKAAGFNNVVCARSLNAVELFAIASVSEVLEDDLMDQLNSHLKSRMKEGDSVRLNN